MSTSNITVELPWYVVRGLIDGEAMVNNDPESPDMTAVRALKSAPKKKVRGGGYRSVVTAPPTVLHHIAEYVWEYAIDSANVLHCYDRFKFSRKVADETVKKLEAAVKAAESQSAN